MRLRDRTMLKKIKLLGLPAPTFNTVVTWAATHQLTEKLRCDVNFLSLCIKFKLTPSFISFYLCNIPSYDDPLITSHISQLRSALLSKSLALAKSRLSSTLYQSKMLNANVKNLVSRNLWTTLVGYSKSSCATVKQDASSNHERKLQRLGMPRQQPTVPRSSIIKPRFATVGMKLDDHDVSALLNLGPSFVPSIKPDSKARQDVLLAFNELSIKLRSRRAVPILGPKTLSEHLSSIAPFPSKKRLFIPQPEPILESSILQLGSALISCFDNETRRQFTSNMTPSEQRGFRKIRRMNHVRISTADKGGGFVMVTKRFDIDATELHLQDPTLYLPSSHKKFEEECALVKRCYYKAVVNVLDSNLADRLNPTNPKPPCLYILYKCHKYLHSELPNLLHVNVKCRPIISGCGGGTDAPSWLLTSLLTPLLKQCPAHLVNIHQLLTQLHSQGSLEGYYYCSFDVEALYTNVDNQSASRALLELLSISNLQLLGISQQKVEDLLVSILGCTVFRFRNQYYKQMRGLAMGNRLAPLLAIVFLNSFEQGCLHRDIILYRRYIDDTLIVSRSRRALELTMQNLNSQHQTIKFTREDPNDDGYISFLNSEVNLQTQVPSVRWFRKECDKGIIIDRRSAVPGYIKANVTQNIRRTAHAISDQANRPQADRMVDELLRANGHTEKVTHHRTPFSVRGGTTLALPYISENFIRSVSKAVKKSKLPIRLVFRTPPSLKTILCHTRIYEDSCDSLDSCHYCKPSTRGICNLVGVVYKVSCPICSHFYIGESGVKLSTRLDSHRRAWCYPNSISNKQNSFSTHRNTCHPTGGQSPPSLVYTVLQRGLRQNAARRIAEAVHIINEKPQLNNKAEMVDIIRLLATTPS